MEGVATFALLLEGDHSEPVVQSAIAAGAMFAAVITMENAPEKTSVILGGIHV